MGAAALTGPVGMEEFAPGRVQPLIGMGAEIIALSLQQVGAEALGALGAVLLPGFPPAIGDLEPPQLSIFN